MRDILASTDVETLVGAEQLQRLEGDSFSRCDCWRCGRPGQTTSATTIVLASIHLANTRDHCGATPAS
jgi:hypothetical protein